jgi:Uma2 family endonuclease
MTTEQLLALPDDGKERWLIRGSMRESDPRRRYRTHDRAQANVSYVLRRWADTRPDAGGTVLVREVVMRMSHDPDTAIGADIAYLERAVPHAEGGFHAIIDAVPILAVQILCPSDTRGEINEKIRVLLNAGVRLVWNVDLKFRTVTSYRSYAEPELFNVTQSISADPHLPGFNVAVADVFSR